LFPKAPLIPRSDPFRVIEKYVSVDDQVTWHDADSPPGPEVPAGSETVWFRFVVTNDGNITLTHVTLSDDFYDVSGCTLTDPLPAGASFDCEIGPFAAEEGQHTNIATVSGDYDGVTYEDSDEASYFGFVLRIGLEQ